MNWGSVKVHQARSPLYDRCAFDLWPCTLRSGRRALWSSECEHRRRKAIFRQLLRRKKLEKCYFSPSDFESPSVEIGRRSWGSPAHKPATQAISFSELLRQAPQARSSYLCDLENLAGLNLICVWSLISLLIRILFLLFFVLLLGNSSW